MTAINLVDYKITILYCPTNLLYMYDTNQDSNPNIKEIYLVETSKSFSLNVSLFYFFLALGVGSNGIVNGFATTATR